MKVYVLNMRNGFGTHFFRGVYSTRELAEAAARKHPPEAQCYYETEEVPTDRFWVDGVDMTRDEVQARS